METMTDSNPSDLRAGDPAAATSGAPSPLPWELVKGTEHHGPYIVNCYGGDVCDLYAMSNPSALSVRNGGDSKPMWFADAAANAALIVRAVNSFDALVKAMEAMCLNMEMDGKAYRDCYKAARAALNLAKGEAT